MEFVRLLAAIGCSLLLACPSGGDDDTATDDDDTADDDTADDDTVDDDTADDDTADDDTADDDTADDDTADDDDDDTTPGANGVEVPERDPDESFEADLSEGSIIELDWAQDSDIACWPGTEDVNFSGNHVFRDGIWGGEEMILYIRVTPATVDLDVSLYALRLGPTDTESWPPEIYQAGCQTSYDNQFDANPGWSEAVLIEGAATHRVVIGVAGANGETSGAFTIDVWDDSPVAD
jgi:hypothetical protein